MSIKAKIAMVCLVIMSLFCSVAYAIEIVPYADTEFSMAYASLATNKTVIFSCSTHQKKDCIKITKCWLQKKVNNDWTKDCDLEAPSVTAENTAAYGAYMDYSSDIGTGTYRIAFTVDADGHSITRYSNERSF